jgi:DMSO/TMAO reductase YedYZ molybdopterin-dependent catalytic subunit
MQMKKTMMALAAMLALNVYGGGFYLTLGNPAASAEAQAAKAVVTVMPTGCHNPAEAKVTATAEGMVNGKRVSSPVKVTALGRKGLHAIARQWPAEGKWALRVVGEYNGATTSALIPVQGDEADRRAAKHQAGVAGEGEIAALLGSH